MLEVQYRMHPAIAELPSACFYDGRLKTQYDAKACPMLPAPLTPGLSFLHVEGREMRRGTSWYNPQQVQGVIRLVSMLLQPNITIRENREGGSSQRLLTCSSIGIIAPYKAMVQELVNRLPPTARAVEVNTVDAFQGREKDVVIYASVRSNRVLGFVSSKQRINVAMTRAKHLLVLVGDKETLLADDHWKKWVQKGRQLDTTVLSAS